MVAVVIGHVAAIGGGGPDVFGEELVLGRIRPVVVVFGMAQVQALDFLQEDDVGVELAQPLAQLMHHHPPVELRKALVDVVGRDVKCWLCATIGQCLAPIVLVWLHMWLHTNGFLEAYCALRLSQG